MAFLSTMACGHARSANRHGHLPVSTHEPWITKFFTNFVTIKNSQQPHPFTTPHTMAGEYSTNCFNFGKEPLATPMANAEVFRKATEAGFDESLFVFCWSSACLPHFIAELTAHHQSHIIKPPSKPLPKADDGYWWFQVGKHEFVQRPRVGLAEKYQGGNWAVSIYM
jgi:hypothetical protein